MPSKCPWSMHATKDRIRWSDHTLLPPPCQPPIASLACLRIAAFSEARSVGARGSAPPARPHARHGQEERQELRAPFSRHVAVAGAGEAAAMLSGAPTGGHRHPPPVLAPSGCLPCQILRYTETAGWEHLVADGDEVQGAVAHRAGQPRAIGRPGQAGYRARVATQRGQHQTLPVPEADRAVCGAAGQEGPVG
jgi:hypothetical protein